MTNNSLLKGRNLQPGHMPQTHRQLKKLANIHTMTDIFHTAILGKEGVKPKTLKLRVS
jgi:hypothetical protein